MIMEKLAEDIVDRYNEKLARAYNELVLPEARSYMAKSLQNVRHKYPMKPNGKDSPTTISSLRNFARTGLLGAAKGKQEDLGYIPPEPERPGLLKQWWDSSREASLPVVLLDGLKSLGKDLFG